MLFLFYIKLVYLKRLRKNRTFFLYNQSKYYYKIKYLLYKEEK
ncbi:Not available [Clostridium perfringens]|nr:Not available [Clostridium perfringens]